MRPEIVKINANHPEASLVTYVAEKIGAGAVVGMPTDTFYGLAADPFNLHAVDRVYEIKTRSRHKPLSLLIESVDQASELAWPVPEVFFLLARRFWPGPLTIIVKASSRLPLKVTANTGNVALRVPASKVAVEVIRAAGVPITATSANISGASECTTADGVRQQLGVDYSVREGALVFERELRKDRISGWRWLLGAWGVGTYRQNDSVDVRYVARDGTPRVAEALDIEIP